MTQETLLNVPGMTCPSCIRHVSAALYDLEGVQRVDVRLQEGRVLVEHDPAKSAVASLMHALHEAGYDSSRP